MSKLPEQRWFIYPQNNQLVNLLSTSVNVSPLIAQVLINRGIITPEEAVIFIDPESQYLPPPLTEFPHLDRSVKLISNAIRNQEKIIICGDYDADGMTSTALLLRAFKHLGASIDYKIPSRMKDGYGINHRIVEECANEGVELILTVDNGISAYEPILHAVELGISVIITDHHDLPEKLPPADAILNPKLLSETSPYRGLAGVGVAYILAITTAQEMGQLKGLTEPLIELFTIGTIADLAPIKGVNRRWLKRGLQRLPKSQIQGIQALIQLSGVSSQNKPLNPDDIGFRIGPRINAIGRIGDPTMIIDLLTTNDQGIALEKAMLCEQNNKTRQEMCEQIEYSAIELIDNTPINYKEKRVLVICQENWHHGVIGIVASRLVERFGVPVFICTVEEEHPDQVRGSARGIEEFNVYDALNYCHDLLGKYGGHKMAGGFSLRKENYPLFQEKLSEFSHQCLQPHHLKPLVKIDVETQFKQLNDRLYREIQSLQPWGIENETPIWWTPNVKIREQRIIGKNHVKFTFADSEGVEIKGVAWRWGSYFPLPSILDIAYTIKENYWNNQVNIEIELVGVKLPENKSILENKKATFTYNSRPYTCVFNGSTGEIRIRNDQGKVLAYNRGEMEGLLGVSRESAKPVDLSKSPYCDMLKLAEYFLQF